MSLNALDTTGVSWHVIDDVKEWRDCLHDQHDRRQRAMLNVTQECYRRDAEYIVQCLRVCLPQESNPQKTTVLVLGYRLTDEAVVVFCEFLQQPNNNLVALHLDGITPEQFHLLLESLHTNTSVKELVILQLRDDEDAMCISNMLQHKNDFIALRFLHCRFRLADIPFLLRRGLTHLQKLAFDSCAIGDEGAHLLFEAIGDGEFPVLSDLDLHNNGITAASLRRFAELGPVARRRLQKLNLSYNHHLLDDLEITQLFIRNMLLSVDMAIKELLMADCGEHTLAIIQACEHDNCKLQVLDISCYSRNLQPIREQLTISMPKMKKLEHLICFGLLFNNAEKSRAAIMAFRQNTSIIEFSISDAATRRLFAPILNRNQHLKHADSLMALQPKTQMPIGSKSGLWANAFATMAEPFIINDEPKSDSDEDDEEDEEDEEDEGDSDEDDEEDEAADDNEEDVDDDDDVTDNSSDDTCSSVEEQESEEDEAHQDGDGEDDNSHSVSRGSYIGASAIFKILQMRPVILIPQLRRPLHQQDAPPTKSGGGGGGGRDAKSVVETDEVAQGRKRRRL